MKTYKHEVRILLSKCSEEICIGLIIRGKGFDGAVSGRNCNELCERLRTKGYIHELRLASGHCDCGLDKLEDNALQELNHLYNFLDKLLYSVSQLLRI